ncbi:MAG TPA: helix-turn-helix domain-containing protein [Pseudonocardiaceae bacterium]|nr:helix-turn-helix domain-containing protein [Pseudonocardiaceae bacterium]
MTEARRRSGTRDKIQSVALELFAEQGYEKTSLREIAERLGVTKAALYYHFPTKDDIVASLFDDFLGEVDQIIDWAGDQVVDASIRKEIVHRYAAVLITGSGAAMLQFVHGNQSAVRDLKHSSRLFDRFRTLNRLLTDPNAALADQIKSNMALAMLHIGTFGPMEVAASTAERQAAALEVALELISAPGNES